MAATHNPNEMKLEELKAIQAKINAEVARIKALIAAESAAEEDAIMNAKADARLIEQADARTAATAQGLTGERDEDGNLIPALDEQMFAGNIPTEEMIEQEIPVIPAKVQQVETDDIPVDVEVETDERPDVESEKRRFGGIDREEGRAESVESEARGEKPGWEMEEGSNTWSVNEKDDYWKTQEGYDEAVALYGSKPAWVKEPTLVWNPSTGEYEEVEEEEFEDLSRPAVSAEVKKLFG
jgi:hypothetical protein